MLISDFKHGLFKYEVKDYFAILGTPIFATPKEVRTRYLKLAYQLHPDTNQGDNKHKAEASIILAKILNPAYKNLYKPEFRKECELILSDISNRLADNIDKVTINSEIAQKLLQEDGRKLKLLYEQTVNKIAQDQYQDFSKLQIKVGLLSELNLIYLVRQEEVQLSGSKRKSAVSSPIISSGGSINKTTVPNSKEKAGNNASGRKRNQASPQEKASMSRFDKLIMSAKSFMERGNYDPAIIELKEAVKLEANNAVVHALLGLTYLEQNNLTYARIHIKKADSLDNKNIEVIKAQEKLEEMETSGKKGSKAKKSSLGKKGKPDKQGKDGKGKKDVPKIFGIPLW
jgi:curved DNA-binding protein CbpA